MFKSTGRNQVLNLAVFFLTNFIRIHSESWCVGFDCLKSENVGGAVEGIDDYSLRSRL